MQVKTLFVGYIPQGEDVNPKHKRTQNDKIFQSMLKEYDLGEIHYCLFSDFKEKVNQINPIIVIVDNESSAREIQTIKKDQFIYILLFPWSIFYRKEKAEKNLEEVKEKLASIAELVQKLRSEDEKEEQKTRKVAAMEYGDWYRFLKEALINDNKDLSQKAWKVFQDGGGMFTWMRVQLLLESWEHSNGKQKEELLTMAMQQHVDNGLAEQGPDFTDLEGREWKQYEFKYPDGTYSRYIRRIPIATKGMTGREYDSLLRQYETPAFTQTLFEAGQAREMKKKYQELAQQDSLKNDKN